MKSLARNLSALTILFTSGHGAADVIYSGFQNITIPATYAGTYIDVDGMTSSTSSFTGWDLNPFMGGVYLSNSEAFQPARDGTGGMDTVLNFAAGTTIGSGLNFATGSGGSLDHLGTEFTVGSEGYLGFKLNGTDYGWMRVVFTNNTGGALVKDWAYNTGGTIATGNVLQSGSTVTLDSAFGSFTLGSPITGGNSVVKTGAGATTLTGVNAYSGTTAVNQGTLALTGSIANSSAIIVGASCTLDVAGVSGGWTLGGSQAQTLSGAGTVTGAATIGSQGILLAPGNGPGDLTFSNSLGLNGTLNLDVAGIGSGQFDRLLGVGNTLTLGGTLNLFNTGYTPVLGDSITVFSGWSSRAGGFTTVTGTDLGGGLSWDTSQLATTGVLTVIPEPNAAALLGGFGVLALLRRRR